MENHNSIFKFLNSKKILDVTKDIKREVFYAHHDDTIENCSKVNLKLI
jgi:hypothetical protein